MIEKLAMGGYGYYVWACFALTAAVFVLNELLARDHHRITYRDAARRIKALEEKQ